MPSLAELAVNIITVCIHIFQLKARSILSDKNAHCGRATNNAEITKYFRDAQKARIDVVDTSSRPR